MAALASAFSGLCLHGSSVSLRSVRVAAPAPLRMPVAAPLTIEAAHKKGAGSTKNGRDSVSKRRGVKVYGGQAIKAGAIIVRQLGNKVRAGAKGCCLPAPRRSTHSPPVATTHAEGLVCKPAGG